MKKMIIATDANIGDIVDLRVEMQIEDWKTTIDKDFTCYASQFSEITRRHIETSTSSCK